MRPVDTVTYRRLSDDIPSGLAVATARIGRWDIASTIDSFLDVSYDPPTMLLSLYGESRLAEAIEEAGTCALTVLSSDQRDLADRFGTSGLPLQGMLNGVAHERDPNGNAVLTGGIASFALEVADVHQAATHRLIVGRVVALADGTAMRPAIRFSRTHYDIV
ncbi:flavin reductase family protein [Helcobacillus massiliensis]|uniref:Flavin reductase (DIM6/NTAB) family NADH-FMN oxidoreductase RutF n=1 Tax=Helcobacillus massiliensis TaxID=521392 RepID=A0A839R3B7_9MICO|nr:flavin reductase family protein [Helcobacillus massiliensis]MBB3023997.1 flavin reductase (DIM6/NTAB) family NADH-FMN oxidoreductase RutF [Helcobacillus massiliensis]MBB3024076.1 flavin reductase (DIM6/NTAB) family NADH-FMN oxidoreductase RutF [Helcobacillus massiliensis]